MLNTALWSIIKAKKSMLRVSGWANGSRFFFFLSHPVLSHGFDLQNKNGFLSRFYRLSSTLSPMFAWGFLGTNEELKQRCLRFKARKTNSPTFLSLLAGASLLPWLTAVCIRPTQAQILDFLQAVFSLERSRYLSVQTLADDMMHHARQTALALSDL